MSKPLLAWLTWAALALAWSGFCSLHATAQEIDDASRRLVRVFDFEDRDDLGRKIGLGVPMPPHWYPIGRSPQESDPTFLAQPLHQQLANLPGFPRWSPLGFDQGQSSSGDFALKLGVLGGSTGVFLESGILSALPGSDYAVSTRVRLAGLERATAQLVAYFIDEQGRRILESVSRQDIPTDTQDAWQDVSVKLMGHHNNAAWIGIELRVMQPKADDRHPLGRQQLVLADVEAAAWFDDISVWKLPHVSVTSQSPVNLIRAPARPNLSVQVRDLTGHRLNSTLTLYDHTLTPVAQMARPVGGGEPTRWDWSPNLPRFGWYLLDLRVTERINGQPTTVARSLGAMLYLDELPMVTHNDRGRFNLSARGTDPRDLSLVVDYLFGVGMTALAVEAWKPDLTPTDLDLWLTELDNQVIRPVSDRDGRLTLLTSPVPEALAERFGFDKPEALDVYAQTPTSWLPFTQPLLMRHGQRVRLWQIGPLTDPSTAPRENLPETLAELDRQFRALSPEPVLIVPWRLDRQPPQGLPSTAAVALAWPQGLKPEVVAQQLKPYLNPPMGLRLHLQPPPADEVGHPSRIDDLMLRVLHAWEADAGELVLTKPWTEAHGRTRALLPDPLLGVYANLLHQLAGRRAIGRMPLGPGLQSIIFNAPGRDRGGLLAAWNVSADPEDATLELYLGENPVAIDPWGNRTPLPVFNGKHRITLTSTPVFIEGIDPELALFRAGFRLDEPFIESTQETHERTLFVTNPWPRTISGQFTITGPERWTIAPQRKQFSLAAGGSMAVPVSLRFPFSEVGGPHQLTADFAFQANQRYRITAGAPMEVGLVDIDFQPSITLEPNPSNPGQVDAVISCLITNTGTKERALFAFASLPGFTRQEQIVSRLEPGQSVVRRFRFRNAADAATENPTRAGLRELNGPAVLNRLVELGQSP
ncbi:MAG: hypothetical protein AAGI68_08780 [Planctomycetota bacterium]